MDKEFKKIFDKIIIEEKAEKDTAKVLAVMDAYQKFLDTAVEIGVMDEHDARMEFCTKSHEVVNQVAMNGKYDEEDNDDAEDEPNNSHIATPEEVEEFVNGCTLDELKKYKTICEGIEELQKSLRAVGLRFSGRMRFDYADRSDDRS